MPVSVKLEIINAALVMTGDNPVEVVPDPVNEGVPDASTAAARLYDPIVLPEALSLRRFAFLRTETRLNKLATAQSVRFDATYQAPAAMIQLAYLVDDGGGKIWPWEHSGEYIHSDDLDALYAVHTAPVAENFYPALFKSGLAHLLASHMWGGLMEDEGKRQSHFAMAMSKFDQLGMIEAQNETPRKVNLNILRAGRRAYGGGRYRFTSS